MEKLVERVFEKIKWEHSIFIWFAINDHWLNRVTIGFFDTHLTAFSHFSPFNCLFDKINGLDQALAMVNEQEKLWVVSVWLFRENA